MKAHAHLLTSQQGDRMQFSNGFKKLLKRSSFEINISTPLNTLGLLKKYVMCLVDCYPYRALLEYMPTQKIGLEFV